MLLRQKNNQTKQNHVVLVILPLLLTNQHINTLRTLAHFSSKSIRSFTHFSSRGISTYTYFSPLSTSTLTHFSSHPIRTVTYFSPHCRAVISRISLPKERALTHISLPIQSVDSCISLTSQPVLSRRLLPNTRSKEPASRSVTVVTLGFLLLFLLLLRRGLLKVKQLMQSFKYEWVNEAASEKHQAESDCGGRQGGGWDHTWRTLFCLRKESNCILEEEKR